jgi:hypothetical protein
MKFLRIIVLAACAAYGGIIGAANLAQATPMSGLLQAAPGVLDIEKLNAQAFPVEKTYYHYRRHYRHYYRRHYWHRPYYRRHYYHRRYYRPYWRHRYYYPYYHRRYYW